MNPFDLNQHPDLRGERIPGLNPFPFAIPPKEIIVAEHTSKVENAIDKTSSSLGRTFKLLIFAGGIAALIALFPPFLRLLWEFSSWSFKEIGRWFP